MGATAITPTALTLNTMADFPTAAAVDATAGAMIPFTAKDDGKILLYLVNSDSSNAENVTIKKGDGVQAAAADYTVSVAASGVKILVVETGKYGFVKDATYKGHIRVTGTADVDVAAVILP